MRSWRLWLVGSHGSTTTAWISDMVCPRKDATTMVTLTTSLIVSLKKARKRLPHVTTTLVGWRARRSTPLASTSPRVVWQGGAQEEVPLEGEDQGARLSHLPKWPWPWLWRSSSAEELERRIEDKLKKYASSPTPREAFASWPLVKMWWVAMIRTSARTLLLRYLISPMISHKGRGADGCFGSLG
jgi:hypothetical protein